MKRRLMLSVTLILLTLVFTACASPGSDEPAVPAAEEAVEVTSQPIDDEFLSIVLPIHQNLEDHLGDEVTIEGFVLYRDSYGENEFMVTRMLVECCFDDASPTGFVTHWDSDDLPEADEWVRATGIIGQREAVDSVTGMTFIQPFLIASHIENIEPYESEYVFIDAE
jgi:putative membrane protein